MAIYKVVMKSSEYVKKLHHIEADLKTDYNNKYPYNLGYNHGTYWSWDCWNLPKTLIWGWSENIKKNGYQAKNLETGLGDWGGWTILNCCRQISTDFSKLKSSEFMLTKDKTHAGTYVGTFGEKYNVIECTANKKIGHKVGRSWVDSDGTRRVCKDGEKIGTWGWHGLLPWLDYTVEPKDVLAVDGSWGMATTRYTQKMLGTTIDGKVSKQPRSNKKYLPACSTTSWEFKLVGGTGSNMVKALQKLIGAEQDGKFGKNSVAKFKAFLKKNGYAISDGANLNATDVKSWQKYVNAYFKK